MFPLVGFNHSISHLAPSHLLPIGWVDGRHMQKDETWLKEDLDIYAAYSLFTLICRVCLKDNELSVKGWQLAALLWMLGVVNRMQAFVCVCWFVCVCLWGCGRADCTDGIIP